MKKPSMALAIAMLCLLEACTTLPAARSMPAATAAPVAQPPVTRLLIDYTPAAQKQTADDARFNDKGFSRILGDGLTAQGLADLANPAVVRVAAIDVEEFDVRATSNVVLMGRVASSGVLGGKVRIRDGSGNPLREFNVRAQVSLKIVRNSTDRNQLDDLYREFARLVVEELSGAVRPQ